MSDLIVVDQAYRVKLWERLRTFERRALLGALAESHAYAPPAADGAPQDDIAQTIHDIALHLESLEDWETCKSLYRRVLGYAVSRTVIHADARFRLAVCEERQGRYEAAIAAFRDAIAREGGAPSVLGAHSRIRLARLLMDAEQFAEAMAALEEVIPLLPVDQLVQHELWLDIGRCALRLGRAGEAIKALTPAVEALRDTEGEVKALRLLAEACERSGETTRAADCYRRIIASGFSEPLTKAAATMRLEKLPGRRR